MNQQERRLFLIQYLLDELGENKKDILIPTDGEGQKKLLRALMNVREPGLADEKFLQIQDEYLAEAAKEKGIVQLGELTPLRERLYIWQGDITRLAVDAIVNAANSGLTGCYTPNHNCIDNCIHTYAGIQLRHACASIIQRQGKREATGSAKITEAFNLPSRYVLHTVGPIVNGRLSDEHKKLLASCYTSCLQLAEENHLKSVAFCCISTGVFGFPNKAAAETAVSAVRGFLHAHNSDISVVFNVFKDQDKELYGQLLG